MSDDSLVNILASLAAETADDMSHDVSRELCDDDVGLADADAMLSSPAVMRLSAEDRREIAEESLEMSQRVWDEDMQTDTAAAAERRDADDMYVLHTHTHAKDSEWQWHQLGHTQVCTSLQTDNHASTPPLSLLQAGCPSCRPTNSVKALKACMYCTN